MNRTLHFKFPLYNNNDKPSILTDYNTTISEIDRVLYALSIATGSSDEYEQKLDELQKDLVELTTIVDEHGKDLTEISQTIATILGSVSALSTKVDGYDDRINTINTRLNNAYVALSKKFDTRSENDLPSQPVYDEENNVYYIKVPYVTTTQDDTSTPQEMTPYLMNSNGFLWYGLRIIEFRIYKDNDESKEMLYQTSLDPNDMVRPTIMKEVTYTYDEQTETDIESWFWVPSYNPIINVQTSIDNSTYSKINVPFNGRVTLSTATKGKKRVIRTVWFSNPCTIYWRGQEVNVEPYKLYHCFQDTDGTGWVTAVYGDDGGSGPDLSLYKRFNYGSYLPAQIGPMANKQASGNLDLTIWNSGGGGNGALMKINTTPLLSQNITPKQIYESSGTSWSFDSNLDRVGLSPGTSILVNYSDLGLSDSYIDGLRYNDVVKDSIEATIYCCIYDNGSVIKYPCNKLVIEYNYNQVRFEISDIIVPAYLRDKTVSNNERIPSEDTEINFEVRADEWSDFMFYILTKTGTIEGTLQPISTTFTPELWRFS